MQKIKTLVPLSPTDPKKLPFVSFFDLIKSILNFDKISQIDSILMK